MTLDDKYKAAKSGLCRGGRKTRQAFDHGRCSVARVARRNPPHSQAGQPKAEKETGGMSDPTPWLKALQSAHELARESIRRAKQYPEDSKYWTSEARRHFERARVWNDGDPADAPEGAEVIVSRVNLFNQGEPVDCPSWLEQIILSAITEDVLIEQAMEDA